MYACMLYCLCCLCMLVYVNALMSVYVHRFDVVTKHKASYAIID